MGLETVTHIADLVATNPTASDPKSQGDDHLRNLKTSLLNDFAGFTGAILVTGTDGGAVNAYTLTPTTALPAYGTKMIAVFAPTAGNTGASTLNISGLGTKNIKDVNGNALTSGDLKSGTIYAAFYNGTEFRLLSITKNYVDQLVFAPVLPAQTGNSGKFLTTDGTNASWSSPLPSQTGNSGKFLTTNGTSASWDYAGISTVGATITDNYTILTATPTIWPCATTALGKSITAPTVTTSTPKGLFAVVDNKSGGYPVGWRDSTGVFIMAVAPGGVMQVYLEDNSTAAGTWRITGTNLEPGLITIDNTFSSTYGSTVHKPFVALDSNKSIHFLTIASNGFAAVAVDNTTGAVGTPVTISATASDVPKAVFKITSTTAIVFYGATNDTLYGAVLTLSGATTLAVGTAANSGSNTNIAVEDFSGAPKVAQLSTSLYLVSWATATGAGNTSVMAISVSGTTVTFGTKADIIAANNVVNSTTTYALTATTGLVIYESGAAAPYTVSGVVISVSGTTCTVGTPASTGTAQVGSATSSCLLSATKALVACDTGQTEMAIYALTISGTTVTAGAKLTVEALAGVSALQYTQDYATRYNPHIWAIGANTAGLWYYGSGISRLVVLSESGGTVTKGSILYDTISRATTGNDGYGAISMQGTTEFLSCIQNGTTSAWDKTVFPHLISGTTINQGRGVKLMGSLGAVPNPLVPLHRLSSGLYVSRVANGPFLSVMKSNGDAISYRGEISIPYLFATASFPAVAEVSAYRAIIMSGTYATTVAAGTFQNRLINVEFAQ